MNTKVFFIKLLISQKSQKRIPTPKGWKHYIKKITNSQALHCCRLWKRRRMRLLVSINRCAQLVRQEDSLELNLLPGVEVMHLSQHTSVSLPTSSFKTAFCFSCCHTYKVHVHTWAHLYSLHNLKRGTKVSNLENTIILHAALRPRLPQLIDGKINPNLL